MRIATPGRPVTVFIGGSTFNLIIGIFGVIIFAG